MRSGRGSRPIPFRCDSPVERRFLELLIKALPDEQVEITSKILRREPREPVKLLEADTPRSKDLLKICSMCKKIEISPGQWAEIEEGLFHLRLFEADEMPQLSHGLCHQCYRAVMEEYHDSKTLSKSVDREEE